jgi:uncharacterized 2Fe-2S/4Fe-4S cluster protein (DUF4445 family)
MNKSTAITVLPQRAEVIVRAGQNLFSALAEAGISLNQACGGNGFCGKCRVKLKTGAPPPTAMESDYLNPDEIARGLRLACHLVPCGGEVVELVPLGNGASHKLELDTGPITVSPWPGLEPLDRVMAVDLGTTNIVGHVLDPSNGAVLHSNARANAQAAFGADVMTRLAYASHGGPETRRRLQNLAMSDLQALTAHPHDDKHPIRHLVAVMNTAMASCLLNWDPDRLGRHPCEAEVEGPVHRKSSFTTGPLAGTQLHLPPVIGGYVGSDTLAALLAVKESGLEPPYLLLDIGTNAEAVLVAGDSTIACSCAAGPAFEGGGIHRGMRAVEGAVHKVRLHLGAPEVSVIGQSAALGITGSGLFSFIGEMIRAQALDRFGVIDPQNLSDGVVSRGRNGRQVRLASHISVSEHDIQQFMLAKAATRAGVEVLLNVNGIPSTALKSIVLCGTFANQLSAEDILAIGLIPPLELSKIRIQGNAAAQGAAMMACSLEKFEEASHFAKGIHHFNLSGNSLFKQSFEEQVCLGDLIL